MVAVGGGVILDEQQIMPGRGAYIHPAPGCITKINQPGRWERALRLQPGSVRPDVLSELAKRLILDVSRSDGRDGDSPPKAHTGRQSPTAGAKKFRL
jgi:predicted RNA-binding protein YlxR (DUF448 family)